MLDAAERSRVAEVADVAVTLPVGICPQALDTTRGLYLNDPTAWT